MLQQDKARDWIVATGEIRTVRELCKNTFEKLKLNYEDYVKINPKFLRPEELKYLKGDSQEIREKLGWKPEYSFEMMIEEMIEYWMDFIKIN